MDKKNIKKEIELDGRTLKLETGKLALQADSSVLASWGDTMVLVTVCTKPLTEDPGYFPLSVEYVEKYYAGGRITAQRFIKRETRPSDKAVLSGRAIDRSVRPLFPKDFRSEVQVMVTVLSFDGSNDPAMLGLIGASAALSISRVPWHGPIGVTIVGKKNGSIVFNPKLTDRELLDMELTVAATSEKVVMVEAEGRETPDGEILDLIKQGFEKSKAIVELIQDFTKEAGKKKVEFTAIHDSVDPKILADAKKIIKDKIHQALFDKTQTWHEATGSLIKQELAVQFTESLTSVQISNLFDKAAKEIMNDTILVSGKRVDGRAMDEVRAINIEVGILPRTHGSAVFQRGDTQVLSIATLGPLSAAQTLEGMEGEASKRFMHHYNMGINPFSTGEVKKIGSPSRRDIGHGDLVERSIVKVLPSEESFPYAIRVVSEILAANASTSMASVCGSTLALLNAGVPIEPVAGIALGLVSSGDKFQVITDMQAVEDFYGEMDFKIAGTLKGVTGIQMDTKLTGLGMEIVEEALLQGSKARGSIIASIKAVMPKEAEISEYAPKIKVTHIEQGDIGALIGPGGKNINKIIADTGAQIDIEDDGTVMVSSTNEESIDKALNAIENMFRKVEVGEVFDGKVVRIAPFGAFVEIFPGKDGLVHVSQMAPGRVEKPEDIVSEGQIVHVRVTDFDATTGKTGLSMLFGADMKPELETRPQGRRSGGFQNRRPFGQERREFGDRRFQRPGGGGMHSSKREPRQGGFQRERGRDRKPRSGF